MEPRQERIGMSVKINGQPVEAKEFGFDGCHKIYLIHTPEDREQLVEYGYDILPISKLPKAWRESCGLKFISDADLNHSDVPQGERAKVTAK